MSAAAALKGWERSRAAQTVRQPLSLATSAAAPRVWLHTRLLDFSHMNWVGRVLAFLYYRVCRQPPAYRDDDGSLKFRDIQCAYGARAEAREACRDRDDCVVGISFGLTYGPRVAEENSFCRPCHPKYGEQDARDTLIYTGELFPGLSAALAELEDVARMAKNA